MVVIGPTSVRTDVGGGQTHLREHMTDDRCLHKICVFHKDTSLPSQFTVVSLFY